MKRDRAAYMRTYRAMRATKVPPDQEDAITAGVRSLQLAGAQDRIAELEAEVARLKRDLAARPAAPAFNSKPFRPVPKR